jgi:hypothetical protein
MSRAATSITTAPRIRFGTKRCVDAVEDVARNDALPPRTAAYGALKKTDHDAAT